MQNLANGPVRTRRSATTSSAGPSPTTRTSPASILRLDDDGAAPRDNPFWATGRAMGGEVGANLQRVFAYGIRNSFGLAFDPRSGDLWEQENGDDSFSELNRVERGMNSGWIQIMGPASRVAAVQGDRDRPDGPAALRPGRVLRPPAGPLAADQHRRHAAGGARPAVHAPRRAVQRSRAELEVRGRARRDRVPGQRRRSAAATTATCSWAGRVTSSRAGTCSAST